MEATALLRLSWLQLGLMAVGMVLVYEVCFRFGRTRPDESREAKRSQTDLAVTALLTLLGLLLAFSFELGATQFEKRRDLVVEDSNAITTTYLRAQLLPSPFDERIRALLRNYIAARAAVTTIAELHAALRLGPVLNEQLWSVATMAAQERDTPLVAHFVDSLNQMMDLATTEVNTSFFQRMPRAIFWVLYLVSFASLGMFGIRGGLDRSRGLASASVLIVIIIAVIGLVDSLDDSESRLFEVSRHAIQAAQQEMARDRHPSEAALQP